MDQSIRMGQLQDPSQVQVGASGFSDSTCIMSCRRYFTLINNDTKIFHLPSMKACLWWIAHFLSDRTKYFLSLASRRTKLNIMSKPQIIPIIPYLEETIRVVDPSFQLRADEQHRKGMMRAVMQISKVQMGHQLRELHSQIQWENAEAFVQEELVLLTPPPDAPQFQEGIRKYKSFEPNHKKLFSFLARGRVYQGKLEKVLEDVMPSLVPTFQQIMDPIPELELLEYYARRQDKSIQELLLKCVHTSFPKASVDSSEVGKARGINSETSLEKYLESKYPDKMVLTNVYISKKPRNGKNQKSPFVIQLPSDLQWERMTSELDALVLDPIQDGDESVRIQEVWEAKATLHAITLYDALSKKHSAVSKIIETDGVRLLLQGRGDFAIQNGTTPSVGIFGSSLLSPKAAARRSQVVICEKLAETSAKVVEEALETGFIQASTDEVLSDLKHTLQLAREIQPIVVVVAAPHDKA
eukprot:scaffold7738_cov133-Cylindrotheca_fusiformis.AAC.5